MYELANEWAGFCSWRAQRQIRFGFTADTADTVPGSVKTGLLCCVGTLLFYSKSFAVQFATLPRRYQRHLHSRTRLLLLLPTARPVYIVLSVADNRPAMEHQSGAACLLLYNRVCAAATAVIPNIADMSSWLTDSGPVAALHALAGTCAHEDHIHAAYLYA